MQHLSLFKIIWLSSPKTLNYLAFQSFDLERIWWRLFLNGVMRTNFHIYVFYLISDYIFYNFGIILLYLSMPNVSPRSIALILDSCWTYYLDIFFHLSTLSVDLRQVTILSHSETFHTRHQLTNHYTIETIIFIIIHYILLSFCLSSQTALSG